MVHSSVGSMVAGENISCERMSGSAMTMATRDTFYCWRRESVIRILQILNPIKYYCSFLDLLSLNKDFFTTGREVSVPWR